MSIARALTSRPQGLTDVGLLIGRVVLGVVFVAHGLQKFDNGIGGTSEGFSQMGVPAPSVAAPFQATLEVVGGALLILGALTTVVGALLAVTMVVAGFIAHSEAFFVTDGGWEFVGVLAGSALLLALTGPGRFSVDGVLAGRAQTPNKAG